MQSARGFEYGVRHIISPRSGPIIDVLVGILEMSASEVLFLLDLGSIYLNHERLNKNSSVSEGDYVRVHTKPRRFVANDGRWRERMLFINEHFVVVNKISSLPVHASVDNIQENLQSYLANELGGEVFVTHRLDVPTRGLIVYARTQEFQSAFNKLLISREMKKVYRARVEGVGLQPGLLRHYMEPSPRAPKKVQRHFQEGFQECLLEILDVKEVSVGVSELRIQLLTGRTHQIRAQLSCEGFPILNDHAYGAKKLNDLEAIELEACELEFTDPLSGENFAFKI
ncbi:RNA pseudouridine synthase [Bdellovibrio bacteriovorus]|uniref:RNA pseudouridine synthase n=1 Tax=Bdellovibrio bacteriovorus TaxID=959 RepID=A0A150WHS4_BDEBC|nr:RluA family pseudouridine synthase [Bdellovibrio bacteriovorus]KYG63138.1 RNA pseudouridine synthase [Bdellovibrio bacteriovorus]